MMHAVCLLIGLSPFALLGAVIWLIGGEPIDIALLWATGTAVACTVAYFAVCLGSVMLDWWEARRS